MYTPIPSIEGQNQQVPKRGFDNNSLRRLSRQFPITSATIIDEFFNDVGSGTSNDMQSHLPTTNSLLESLLSPDLEPALLGVKRDRGPLEYSLPIGQEPAYQNFRKRQRMNSQPCLQEIDGSLMLNQRNFSLDGINGLDVQKPFDTLLNSMDAMNNLDPTNVDGGKKMYLPITPIEWDNNNCHNLSSQSLFQVNPHINQYNLGNQQQQFQSAIENQFQSQSSKSTNMFLSEASKFSDIERLQNNSGESMLSVAQTEQDTGYSSDLDDEKPRKQNLKFAGDLYTPKLVRFSGVKKEGICDICDPNKWLQLKNSAYW